MTASVLCNQQIFNAYLIWADTSVNLDHSSPKLDQTQSDEWSIFKRES